MINITDVNIFKQDMNNLKGFASITIDECFVVKGFRVMDGKNGLFVAMPSQKGKDGEWHDVAHPITAEAREVIMNTILKAYNNA